MRDNAALALRGRNVVLVPYTAEHVPRYHEWMASEELQRLTASEPLSLEAEFEMQQSWRNDADKCTFIVLAQLDGTNPLQSDTDEIANMAGDVNLFLNDPDEPHTAEVEIMIAEPKFRRRGLAREAILMMLDYGVRDLHLTKFVVKIGLDNNASRELFRKLGFAFVSESRVFQEETLSLDVATPEQQTHIQQLLTSAIEPVSTVERLRYPTSTSSS